MNELTKQMTWEEVVARDKSIIDKICSDENYAYFFVYSACEPILKRIAWSVFKNDVNHDELANELYLHLKSPNDQGELWHNLRTFDFRTSLFDWIKTVAIRLFVKKKNEPLFIPSELIENGIIADIVLKLEKSLDRKLLTQFIIEGKSQEELCDKYGLDSKSLKSTIASLIRKVRNLVRKFHPEYESLLQPKLAESKDDSKVEDSNIRIENKLDIAALVSRMPNKRYQYVVQRLYLDEALPDEIAIELNTPVSNIYNLKLRALDQLRDVAILSKEFPDIKKHINFMSNDRLKDIATSLLVKGNRYEEVASTFSLSQSEFRQVKKEILSELKKTMYKKD